VIDLHCHILPGIDDGPGDMEASLELARVAAAEGTQVIAATPHLREDHPLVRPDELADRCAEVNQALEAAGIALEVVPGGEVDLMWAHQASDEELCLVSYRQRGTDLLLETPYGTLPPHFEELAYDRMSSAGYRVLLAHPERSYTFQQDPGRLRAFAERGVLVQVTASSLLGRRRSATRKLTRWLIEEGVAHVLASDGHSAEELRPPLLGQGAREAGKLHRARAGWMTEDVPRSVLAGEPLPPLPDQPRRRGLLATAVKRAPS
jgi:protein-tyrosine phosphatase